MKAATVDEYIANCPQEIQSKLQKLRLLIGKLAPTAEEKISYAMPFYAYKGRLVYFALMKNYIGLYIPPPIIEQHTEDLKNYVTTKSAIHIPLNKELPIALIDKLIHARKQWNEQQEKEEITRTK